MKNRGLERGGGSSDGGMEEVKDRQTLTQRHLAGFAQLRVMRLLHLLVGQDLLQSAREEHVLGLLALVHVSGGGARGSC